MTKQIVAASKKREEDVVMYQKKRMFAKTALMMLTVVSVLLSTAVVGFAAPDASDTITTAVKGGLGDVWGVIQGISIPIAVVSFGFGVCQIFTGGEKGMDRAKKIFLYTLIGFGLIWLAPLIIETVSSWFQSAAGTSSVFS